jgi:hypothetical protein
MLDIQTEIIVKTKPFNQRLRHRKPLFCPRCNGETEMMTVADAALIIGCSSYAIKGWCKLGWLHFTQRDAEPFLICSNSLAEIIKLKDPN